MKKYFILLFLMGFVLSPKLVFASAYQGASFGSTDVNTCFSDSGNTCESQPIYKNAGSSIWLIRGASNYWRVFHAGAYECPVETSGNVYYYGTGATLDVVSWTVYQGASPGGSFTSVGSCGGGTSTKTASTTVVMAQAGGIILMWYFLEGFALMIFMTILGVLIYQFGRFWAGIIKMKL